MLNNVAIISGWEGAARRYRCYHPQEQLLLYGVGCVVHHYTDTAELQKALDHCRIFIFHRTPYDTFLGQLIQQVHEKGGVAVFDTDDLIFDASAALAGNSLRTINRIERAVRIEEIQRLRRAMGLCDAILVPTKFLAQKASVFGKPIWVHRNAFSLEMLSISEEARVASKHRRNKVVIGYASGTPTHDHDFQEVKPVVQQILHKYSETELWIIGYLNPGSDWGKVRNGIKQVPYMCWRKLPYFIAQFDINIAPLEINNPFCQAKSEVKYIEAGLVGVPTVASKTDAFEYSIRPGDNGLLAETQDEWYEHLETLVKNADFRREIGKRAREDVLKRYNPVVRGRELVYTLNDIGRRIYEQPFWPHLEVLPRNEDSLCWKLSEHSSLYPVSLPERPPSLVRKVLYSLRYRGFRIFFLQALLFLMKRLPWYRKQLL